MQEAQKNLKKLKNINLLYVEDDLTLHKNTYKVLENFFAKVFSAYDGESALNIFQKESIHVVITDIDMPKLNGLELTKAVRKLNSRIPIFITTSYTDNDYLLQAIKLNLVDYLIKPVSFSKLKTALLECIVKLEENNLLTTPLSKTLTYNFLQQELYLEDEPIQLTKREILFLELLLQHRGAVVAEEQLKVKVYEQEYVSEDAIRNLVYRLRKKLGKDVLHTSKLQGYYIS